MNQIKERLNGQRTPQFHYEQFALLSSALRERQPDTFDRLIMNKGVLVTTLNMANVMNASYEFLREHGFLPDARFVAERTGMSRQGATVHLEVSRELCIFARSTPWGREVLGMRNEHNGNTSAK